MGGRGATGIGRAGVGRGRGTRRSAQQQRRNNRRRREQKEKEWKDFLDEDAFKEFNPNARRNNQRQRSRLTEEGILGIAFGNLANFFR